MKHKWLAFTSFAALALVVVVFFYYQSTPIDLESYFAETEIESITQPTTTFVNPSKGLEDAEIVMVVFSDFDCFACKQLANSIDIVIATFPENVRVVWKNMPQESADSLATSYAEAAHCADRQERFWEYHDELFNRQSYLNEDQLLQVASDLELDVERFVSCYTSQDTAAIVMRDYEEGLGLDLLAAPTIFLNGESLVGAVSTETLISSVQQILAQ